MCCFRTLWIPSCPRARRLVQSFHHRASRSDVGMLQWPARWSRYPGVLQVCLVFDTRCFNICGTRRVELSPPLLLVARGAFCRQLTHGAGDTCMCIDFLRRGSSSYRSLIFQALRWQDRNTPFRRQVGWWRMVCQVASAQRRCSVLLRRRVWRRSSLGVLSC